MSRAAGGSGDRKGSRANQPLSSEAFLGILRRVTPVFGLTLDSSISGLVSRFLSELDRWRRRVNLTGDLSPEDLCAHALESVLGGELIAHGARVVDIGSGAGFPGLPILISRADLAVTLVEPRQKRTAFLRHVARDLKLCGATVFEGRIEEVGGQTFGTATTRAVGDVARWIGDARFLEPGGRLLAWTTEPRELGQRLSPALSLESTLSIPGSSRRTIAAYRKR